MEKHYADLKAKKFFPASSHTWSPDPSAPWFGKAITPSLPDARCSAQPCPETPSPVPSAVTSASMLAVTSATDPMPLSPPTTRLPSGSPNPSSTPGTTAPPPGFTNEQT